MFGRTSPSIRRAWWRSYLWVLLLPILCCALALLWTILTIYDETERSADRQARQYAALMEEQANLAVRFCNMVSNEPNILSLLAHGSFDRYLSYISKLKLNVFSLIGDYQGDFYISEILRQYFINHPQSIDKYTFLQNSAFTHWVKEKCSKMC